MIDLDKLRQIYKFGKEISLSDVQLILKVAKLETLKKKEFVIEQGSKSTKVYYIRKGLVRMYHINELGDDITFKLLPEHHVIANFDFLLEGKPSKYYFETLEKTSVFSSDYQTLDGIASKYPKLESNRKFFLRKLLTEAKDRIESFVLLTPEQRYLKFTKDFPDMCNRVPDKYIAHVLGITPVSLSRVRKRIASKP